MSGMGSRVSACKAMLDISRAEFVYNTLHISGKEIMLEEVNETLTSTNTNCDNEVVHVSKAFDYIKVCYREEEDLALITKVYDIMCNYQTDINNMTDDNVISIKQIHSMQPSF